MKQAHLSDATDTTQEVWGLTSYRAGETSQILALTSALADSLGTRWQRIDIDYRPWAGPVGLLRLQSLIGSRTRLAGPWPKFLISAGLRNEPVCRWIRQASGGHTRLIFLGRTWAKVRHFDLVVATPQYRLNPAANVLENPLTLHPITAEVLAQAQRKFSSRYGQAGGLKVGVLLGGNSGPYRFDHSYARQLAKELNELAASSQIQMCFLISSSSRTPETFLTHLKAHMQVQHDIHDWRDPGENPYPGILAWSDTIVVSADSIAMISEAVATNKRVLLSEPSLARTIASKLYHSAIGWGHKRWTRDVSLVHAELLRLELAQWLGDAGTERQFCGQPTPSGAGKSGDCGGTTNTMANDQVKNTLDNKGAYLQRTVDHIRSQMP